MTCFCRPCLKAKGIDAQSILINGDTSYTMTQVPTFVTLNHVITYLPEFQLYLDSSAAVAPFGVLPMQEYGKPMVVATATSAALGTMPVLAPGLAKVVFKTASVLDKDGVLTGTSTTIASGPYAITLRSVGLGIQAVGPTAPEKLLTVLGYKDATGTLTQDSPVALTPSHTISGTFKAPGMSDVLLGRNGFIPGGLRLFSLSGEGMMGPFDPGKLKKGEPTPCVSAEATEDLSLKAPPGMHFAEVPKDTRVQTPNLLFTAHWSLDADTLSVHRDFTSTIDQPLCQGAIREQTAAALKQIAESYNTTISFMGPGGNASGQANASNPDYASGMKHFKAGRICSRDHRFRQGDSGESR